MLKNIHYIGCLGKKSEDLWLEVAEYIDKKYDVKNIEKVLHIRLSPLPVIQKQQRQG